MDRTPMGLTFPSCSYRAHIAKHIPILCLRSPDIAAKQATLVRCGPQPTAQSVERLAEVQPGIGVVQHQVCCPMASLLT